MLWREGVREDPEPQAKVIVKDSGADDKHCQRQWRRSMFVHTVGTCQ